MMFVYCKYKFTSLIFALKSADHGICYKVSYFYTEVIHFRLEVLYLDHGNFRRGGGGIAPIPMPLQ